MNARRQAQQLADLLAPAVEAARGLDEPPDDRWGKVLPARDQQVSVAVLYELRHLVREGLVPCAPAQDDHAPASVHPEETREALVQALSEPSCRSRSYLWSLLTPRGRHEQSPALSKTAHHRRGRLIRIGFPPWVGRQVIAGCLNVVIILVIFLSLFYHYSWDLTKWSRFGLLKLFAIWAMSFLPGWLFVRFLGQRARALWWEFALSLHRLGVDEPRYLPEPPLTSEYHRRWVDAGGAPFSRFDNVYREKFDAYYGKSVSRLGTNEETRIRPETVFPVVLLSAVLAAAWTAVLWDVSFASAPNGPVDVQKLGFLGAYAFIIQMLVRRYFQSDLRASAYASSVVRIFVVAILVAVVHEIPGLADRPQLEAVVAFIVGFFPLVGMQALQRVAASVLRTVVPSLNPAYPLNQIDGLNVWYEARLLEEGIEDMQNLTTANLVDVILHTHVPVGRLVDWVDQAFLYQHLDRTERSARERHRARRETVRIYKAAGRGEKAATTGSSTASAGLPPAGGAQEARAGFRLGSREKHILRRLGIRTATDLLDVLPLPHDDCDLAWMHDNDLDPYAVGKLVTALQHEQGLSLIRNWQAGSASAAGSQEN